MPLETETMAFARAENGRVVHIDEIENGLACGCVCLKCWGKVVARKGNVRQHHFSHYKADAGLRCTETALHCAAKAILKLERRLVLPPQHEGIGIGAAIEAVFDSVSLERCLGSGPDGTEIIADAYGEGAMDVVIEIAVHHRVPQDKAEKIRRLGLPAVEIDLANSASSLWDWDALGHAVITDPQRRHWINLPEPELVAKEDFAIETRDRTWRFRIRGAPVVARRLPFRNVSVWHTFNAEVREVVEKICRGRGWWHGKHRNWVVFDHFWPDVFAELQEASEAMADDKR